MPTVRCLFGYNIYVWSDEGNPVEPIHFHVSKGKPSPHADKYWILSNGYIAADQKNRTINRRDSLKIIQSIDNQTVEDIKSEWIRIHGEIKYKM
jgi:hypothetical protein